MNDATNGTAPVVLEVKGLCKTYQTEAGEVPVLKDVDLEVRAGEMVAIMGPSGSGKSSMLLVLGLLQPPSSGSYTVQGIDVFKLGRSGQAEFRRKRVGFVFQSSNMFEHSTVYENLEFPLIYARVPKRFRKKMILDSLEQVNLSHRVYHRTNKLSGGEQQRVAIARALVNQPLILLGDEPTGQLDTKNGERVMQNFRQVVSTGIRAMVLVTHDPKVADHCTSAFFLEDGALRRIK